jgi:GNAT superfamily N-acetyltransferase
LRCGVERGRIVVAERTMLELTSRHAVMADVSELTALMDAAISELQTGFLDDGQIEASRTIMGLDTELIEDGTYFVVAIDGEVAGCGGWSRRATLYGGNQTSGRDSGLLDPAVDAARVRAMYTHPRFARRGVGRRILSLCEEAAAAEGFKRLELMATLSGEPLYSAYGFQAGERLLIDTANGVSVPCVRMHKSVRPDLLT